MKRLADIYVVGIHQQKMCKQIVNAIKYMPNYFYWNSLYAECSINYF